MDLAALWRSRRWRLLLNLIDRLPRASHFVEALADDDQLAERVADAASISTQTGPRMSEWDELHAALAAVHDRMNDVIRAVLAAGGVTPPDLPTYPRPVTAADRVRSRRARDRHLWLVAQVLPDIDPEATPSA